MKKIKKGLKDKELYIINFYGILSFISMLVFIIFAIINANFSENTFAFNTVNVISAIGFVSSVVFAAFSVCSTIKLREYGAILAMITLIIISGTVVALYYNSLINSNQKNDVDLALKCAHAKKCSIIEDGSYSCILEDETEIICPNEWFQYYLK